MGVPPPPGERGERERGERERKQEKRGGERKEGRGDGGEGDENGLGGAMVELQSKITYTTVCVIAAYQKMSQENIHVFSMCMLYLPSECVWGNYVL